MCTTKKEHKVVDKLHIWKLKAAFAWEMIHNLKRWNFIGKITEIRTLLSNTLNNFIHYLYWMRSFIVESLKNFEDGVCVYIHFFFFGQSVFDIVMQHHTIHFELMNMTELNLERTKMKLCTYNSLLFIKLPNLINHFVG